MTKIDLRFFKTFSLAEAISVRWTRVVDRFDMNIVLSPVIPQNNLKRFSEKTDHVGCQNKLVEVADSKFPFSFWCNEVRNFASLLTVKQTWQLQVKNIARCGWSVRSCTSDGSYPVIFRKMSRGLVTNPQIIRPFKTGTDQMSLTC